MANNFPYLFESNFERGTNADWDSEDDTGSRLDFAHYGVLATYNPVTVGAIAPWRGAYCMRILAGDTNDHVLIEGDIDIADTATGYTRFELFIGKDFAATADDTFVLFEYQGTANAVEGCVGLRITAATQAIELGVGSTAPSVFATQPLQRGEWNCIELVTLVSTTGTGTSTVFLNDAQVATIGTITNTAVLRGVFGTQDTLATTTGHLFFDAFIFDTGGVGTRIGRHRDRYPETIFVTQSQHVCLGQSELLNLTLLPGNATNNVLKVYDTDRAYTQSDENIVASLNNLTASEPPIDLADVPLCVKRGAYVQLSGTAPSALVHIGKSQGYGSHGRVRQHGYNQTGGNKVTQ